MISRLLNAVLLAGAAVSAPGTACPPQPRTAAGVIATEKAWVAALERRDSAALACILDPGFSDQDWRGGRVSRAQVLARLPRRPSSTLHLSDLQVTVEGTMAMVRGLNTQADAAGKVSGSVRFTDVFAYRGGRWQALAAQETLVTFIFFAVVTGVGGGTLRDLLIGAPVFWVHVNGTLLICIAAGLAVWLTSRRRFAGKALLWFDAAGMAAYATYGAAKALAYGVAPVPAFAMGVMTACVGGIIRDVLAGEPSILMRPELYVTAAALASGLFVVLVLFGITVWAAAAIAIAAGFALRGAAIARGWSLPAYRD